MILTILSVFLVGWTAAIQILLWRDKNIAAKAESLESSQDSDSPQRPEREAIDVDEKKVVRDDLRAI